MITYEATTHIMRGSIHHFENNPVIKVVFFHSGSYAIHIGKPEFYIKIVSTVIRHQQ